VRSGASLARRVARARCARSFPANRARIKEHWHSQLPTGRMPCGGIGYLRNSKHGHRLARARLAWPRGAGAERRVARARRAASSSAWESSAAVDVA